MSDTADIDTVPTKTAKSKMPMIIGLVLALAGGGGGFYAASSGMLGGKKDATSDHAKADGDSGDKEAQGATAELGTAASIKDVSFVEVPILVVSMGPAAQSRHLRFRASLEVPSEHASDVTNVMPRVQDVLNSYLRALETSDIEAPGALMKLRGQMLRRVQLVVGADHVRDLLVLEFVLN